MSGEIQATFTTGATLYAVVINSTGDVWNGSTFDASPTSGEWTGYAVTMTEGGGSGYYRGTMPAAAAGIYSYNVHKQIGGSAEATDPVVWTGSGDWSGSAWAYQSGDSFARIGAAGASLTALALATSTTAAAIRSALGMAAADLDTQLDSIAAVTDPLLNSVPGSYPSGSAGFSLGRIGSGQITTVSLVSQDGNIPELIGGATYKATAGTSFDWTDASAAWPTLTSATVAVAMAHPDGQTASYSGSVVTATGSGKTVRLELTAVQSAALQALNVGRWSIMVWATLTGGEIIPLVRGYANVIDRPGP